MYNIGRREAIVVFKPAFPCMFRMLILTWVIYMPILSVSYEWLFPVDVAWRT